MRIKEFFIPQEKKFFDMIYEQSLKIKEGVSTLDKMFKDFANIQKNRGKIKKIENEADELLHKIFNELNSTFITPIDREDISEITSRLDDIMDSVYAAANCTYLYGIKKSTKHMKKFSKCLLAQTEELTTLLLKFKNLKNREEILQLCIEINRLENVADDILNESLMELFKGGDIMMTIKLKEIYENLEDATDRCEDVADIINRVLIKNS